MARQDGAVRRKVEVDVEWEHTSGATIESTELLLYPYFSKVGEWFSPFYWTKQTFHGPKKIQAPAFVQVLIGCGPYSEKQLNAVYVNAVRFV